MERVYGRRSHRSDDLILLAERVHELERAATTDAARHHYASVAAEYELRAGQVRAMEDAAHKQG